MLVRVCLRVLWQIESLMERLKDMATAGVSAVAAARAAKNTLRKRHSSCSAAEQAGEGKGYELGEEEEQEGDVYDELARFQVTYSDERGDLF